MTTKIHDFVPPLEKKSKISKNQSFVKKLYSFWICIVHVHSSFEMKKTIEYSSWDFEYVLDTMDNY